MNKYQLENIPFAPVQGSRVRDAAEAFADKLARREYGRRGMVWALRLLGLADGTAIYEALLGASDRPGISSVEMTIKIICK